MLTQEKERRESGIFRSFPPEISRTGLQYSKIASFRDVLHRQQVAVVSSGAVDGRWIVAVATYMQESYTCIIQWYMAEKCHIHDMTENDRYDYLT